MEKTKLTHDWQNALSQAAEFNGLQLGDAVKLTLIEGNLTKLEVTR